MNSRNTTLDLPGVPTLDQHAPMPRVKANTVPAPRRNTPIADKPAQVLFTTHGVRCEAACSNVMGAMTIAKVLRRASDAGCYAIGEVTLWQGGALLAL